MPPGSSGSRRTQPRRLGRIVAQGPIAQLVERLAGSQEVRGSTPLGSTERGAPPEEQPSAALRARTLSSGGCGPSCQGQTIARRGEWADVRAGKRQGSWEPSRHLAQLLDGLPVTDRRLDVAGTSTPVLEGGTGAPIILLHGIGGFAEEWACAVPKLVSSHRVVVPDLPGLGRSRLGNATLDAASVVEWLRLLIDQTCDEPPTLVGHSLGGGIAARFAIAHPDMIRRVVLEDSSSLGRFRPAPGLVVAIVRFGARPTQGKPRAVPPSGPVRSRPGGGGMGRSMVRVRGLRHRARGRQGREQGDRPIGQAYRGPKDPAGTARFDHGAGRVDMGNRGPPDAVPDRQSESPRHSTGPCIRSRSADTAPTSNGPVPSSRRWRRRSLLARSEHDRGALVVRTSQGERTPAQAVRQGSAEVRQGVGLNRALVLRL